MKNKWIPQDATHFLIRKQRDYVAEIEFTNLTKAPPGFKSISDLAKELAISDVCQQIASKSSDPVRNKYHREIKRIKCECGTTHSVWVDVYDVLRAFNVICGAVAHAIKKLLAPGLRGSKSERQDISEAKDSLGRAVETIDEWA